MAWLREGSAQGAEWTADLRSYKGPLGGGDQARSLGCTAVEGVFYSQWMGGCWLVGHKERTGGPCAVLQPSL